MKKIFVFLCMALLFAVSTVTAQGYQSHKVKKGETIEGIAREYGLKPADIYKYNPEAQKGIHENTILIIPTKTEETAVADAGVTFKEHKVKKKETLFSISQEYGVSVDDIKKYNTQLYSRELEKGDVLQIPVGKKSMVQQTVESQPVANGGQTLEKYTVQKSEGLYRVAANHGITVEALKQLNPGLGDTLNEGDTLWVPVTKNGGNEDAGEYDYYTVQPGEGFYRVEKNTGFSQEMIEKLNPQIALEGLKAGMILKLPKKQSSTIAVFQSTPGVLNPGLLKSIRLKRVDLALVLPFKAQGMSLDSVPLMVTELKNNRLLNISLDFYSGVLEAVDSLQRYGLDVRLKVLDSQGDEMVIKKLVDDGAFNNVNAVIGPLYDKTFNRLANDLYVKNIPLFAPLTNKNLKHFSNVFSTVPTDEDLRSALLSYTKIKDAGSNVLVFADDDLKDAKAAILSVFPSAKTLGKEMISVSGIRSLLSNSKKNLVFVESNSVPVLTNLTNMLNTLVSEGFKIQVATTLKTDAYNSDSVRNEYLSNLNLLYATIDKPASNKLFFAKQYQEKYKKYPNKIVTRGFDLGMDVALRIAQGQSLQANSSIIGETVYIENKFHYISEPLGSFVNNAVFIVMYKDMEVVEAP